MTTRYLIREQAQNDLEEIWLYTFNEWGVIQADKYIQQILSRFKWISKNPTLGKARDDVKHGYFAFPEGMHVVFYMISNNHIEIIGTPHRSMDVVSYFENAD